MNSTLCVCTAKAEYQNTTYPSCGHPLTLDIQRFTGKNYKKNPGDFHTVLDVIFNVLIQFQNKALVCTFSCVYLPLLQPAQNKEILNIYWLHMPINVSFSHFYDVSDVLMSCDYFPFIIGFSGLTLSDDDIFIIAVLK